MGITSERHDGGIAEVVVDYPPVNALPVAGWFDLARTLRDLGDDPAVHVVVLRAEGRGFNAGVDIKEMQASEGFDALIGANKGCFAAFAAVYDCPVPVIVAVHGFCLGGGVGLVGNADVVIASDDATFGLPEVDRGALGAATHLARLVPQHKMRAMVYLVHLGLQAAAWRVPFLPSRVGLGSDLLRDNKTLRSVTSPFDDGEELLAMPAFQLDAAICHLNRSDARGNAMFLGPDLYWDDLMLQSAPTGRRFISTERVVPTEALQGEGCLHQLRISRMMVDGVVEAPGGAHFTACAPDYGRDEAFQKAYAASAASPEAWASFRAEWIDIPEADYQKKVADR